PVGIDCYTFAAVVGDLVHVDAVQTAGPGALDFLMFDPTGEFVDHVCFPDREFSCRVTVGGTQTVVVTGDRADPGDYSLSVQRLDQPVGCTALGFGAPATAGSIGAPAEVDCLTFTGAVGDEVRIRAVPTSDTLAARVVVFRQNGTEECFE